MQMQITDAPKYDDLFIMPGPFHIELAFSKAIGKIVETSGGPEMLNDSGVLAPGSLNGFLQGKHFNRCRRLHPILAFTLELLHFQAFMETCKQSNYFSYSELAVVLGNLQDDTDSTTWSSVQLSDVFTSCVEKYETHREETRSGTHGTTAQSWIMYVDYIHDFHNLECAIRTNDINLFLHALTPTCSLQPRYVGWSQSPVELQLYL